MDKNNKTFKKLVMIGGGSGNPDYLLPVAQKALQNADCIVTPERFLPMLKDLNLKIEILRNIPEFLEQLPERLQSEQIAVLVSGDPLYYSLCRTILKRYPEIETEILPGIGSLQLLGTAFWITMEDAAVLSLHGRTCSPGKIAMTIAEHSVTFFFCSADHGARQIAEILLNYNLKNLKFYVGSDLGCPKQKLNSGAPENFLQFQNPALHVVAVKNPAPRQVSRPALLPDDAFLRNQSPMTKEEVRAVILNKLKLHPDHVIWDIGAGTGSISIECARFCPFGNVYAIEYQNSALEILEKNKNYFGLENLEIIPGTAPEILKDLPLPDCVFIGGTGKKFPKIFNLLQNLQKKIRLVISAVTLESQTEIYQGLKNIPDLEITRISIAHAKSIKNYHILQENNAVMIYSCIVGC
ncbi:MAG: precorrin-6Y C5,15-methyltransferase (decarboxylating) subunit CbiT [Oscillospiraceae bacterium]|nr:precorrin-6Y C5,15-methyltransferase (decarboxylating) subunit CbiT [Oscillospiraceae bacterium]